MASKLTIDRVSGDHSGNLLKGCATVSVTGCVSRGSAKQLSCEGELALTGWLKVGRWIGYSKQMLGDGPLVGRS